MVYRLMQSLYLSNNHIPFFQALSFVKFSYTHVQPTSALLYDFILFVTHLYKKNVTAHKVSVYFVIYNFFLHFLQFIFFFDKNITKYRNEYYTIKCLFTKRHELVIYTFVYLTQFMFSSFLTITPQPSHHPSSYIALS